MNLENYQAGKYIRQDGYDSFLPEKINKEWTWRDPEINTLLEKANQSLGGLNSYSDLIPNIDIYIALHLKTEAHKSNKIEGTKTTIEEDLMKIEDLSPEKRDDRIEVQNYILAMNEGINKITKENFPLSSRLIRELHRTLLQGARGEHKTPGEFRKSQNWLGGASPSSAVYVPPSHIDVPELISDLEFFMNNDKINVPDLIKIALIHYQFETIHPFLDGNGRMGRLLIPLYLLERRVLSKPCFYISDYFEKNRSMYYDLLTRVRQNNDMLAWIKFFLKASISTSDIAKDKFRRVVDLVEGYRKWEYELRGKPENIQKIFLEFYNNPILSVSDLEQATGLSRSAVRNVVNQLEEKNIVVETTGFSRNKLYLLKDYFMIFAE